MECLDGNLKQVYLKSNPNLIFQVPNFCICDPIYERDYDIMKKKYKNKEEKTITVALYYVEKNKNIKIQTTDKTEVKAIKEIFASKSDINISEYNIRLFFKGLELLDENLLCYNKIENMSKIHVMINHK